MTEKMPQRAEFMVSITLCDGLKKYDESCVSSPTELLFSELHYFFCTIILPHTPLSILFRNPSGILQQPQR